MYKLLLSWRYLCTRYIALASIVSVTLGVATLIIVNAVMAGFTEEANKRLNGILSDIVFESISLNGLGIRSGTKPRSARCLGPDLAGMTATVSVPAMLSIPVGRDQYLTRQVNLIGVDEETYAEVGDFGQYLLHPENRRQLSFALRQDGYGPERAKFPPAGWRYRRARIMYERAYEEQVALERQKLAEQRRLAQGADAVPAGRRSRPCRPTRTRARPRQTRTPSRKPSAGVRSADAAVDRRHPGDRRVQPADAGRRGRSADFYFCRPGDDVKITIPTAGSPPRAVNGVLTVVDIYESKMSEYDASFAFMPLEALQNLRGMFDAQHNTAVCHFHPDQAQAGHRPERGARSAASSFSGQGLSLSHPDVA